MFLLGLGALFFQSIQFAEASRDPFAGALRATAMAIMAIMPIGDIFSGSTGVLLWSVLGLGISAHAYHLATTGLAPQVRGPPWRFQARCARAAVGGACQRRGYSATTRSMSAASAPLYASTSR